MPISFLDFKLSITDKKSIRKAAEQAVISLGLQSLEISIVSITSQRIKKLNKTYRKKDQITDVLSFGYEKEGEVFICLPQAKRQAKANKIDILDELKKLIIHGLAHIAGYDHIKQSDYEKMKKIEDKILKLCV